MKKTIALAALLAAMAVPAAAQTMMVQPGAAAPAGAVIAAPTDRETFRLMAMMSDSFEIASSRLAMERSRNARVRAYAETMIRDHAMTSQALNGGTVVYGANGDLTTGSVGGAALGAGVGFLAGGPIGAAVGAGVGAGVGASSGSVAVAAPMRTAVPLDAQKMAMLNQLSAAQGRQFDRLYGQMQLMAHQEALALYTGYAQAGNDPQMRTFAQSVIPHLEHHVAMARRLPR